MTIYDKKGIITNTLGKIKRFEEKEIEVLNRIVLVKVWEYSSGNQRCKCCFNDKNKNSLIHQNVLLRQKVQELEEKLENKTL